MITEVQDNEIYFAKMRPDAKIPTKKEEDAGYDMYACFDEDYFVIEPFASRPVPTGIASAFSKKYYIQIEERSSMGKMGIKKNGGVFDSGYRGEYWIVTYNTHDKPFVISKIAEEDIPNTIIIDGKTYNKADIMIYPYTKAICQAVLQEVPMLESKEISYEDLKAIPSSRGVTGFGASGK